METVIFILVLLLGPFILSLPFLGLFKVSNDPLPRSFYWIYFIFILIITIIWAWVMLTQIEGTPIHIS